MSTSTSAGTSAGGAPRGWPTSPSVPTIVVRCDLGPTYGVGHLMRCIALAEELAADGARVVFCADASGMPFALEQLASRGFDWVAPPAPTTEAHLAQLEELGADAVVVDSYHLPIEVYAGIRAVLPTLALVDGDPQGRSGDLLLDQNIGAEDDEWPLAAGSVRLAGLDYALMRTDLLAARRALDAEHREHDPLRVFAFFGGTDAFGAAPDLARALVATGRPFALRVVGATSPLREALAAVTPAPGQAVEVIEPTSALVEEVVAADVVVSAAGTSSWELLCLGAACAFVCVAENQRLSYDRVVARGVVAGLGTLGDVRSDSAHAVRVLARLLGDPEERDRLRRGARDLVDGRGRTRVTESFADVWRAREGRPRLI